MTKKAFHEDLEELAQESIGVVRQYLRANEDHIVDPDIAKMGASMIGQNVKYGGVLAKRAEVAISAAKLIGLRGNALHGIFEQVTGTKVLALPDAGERSNAEDEAA